MARTLVATRLDSEVYDKLKDLSGKEDRSVARLARKAIELYLDNADGRRKRSHRKGG